jgi:hypothetical protein
LLLGDVPANPARRKGDGHMRFFPARSVNLKSAVAVPAALATRPAEAMERAQAAATEIMEAVERGRSVASELVEAARAAMPI